jgi:hypothetical protein
LRDLRPARRIKPVPFVLRFRSKIVTYRKRCPVIWSLTFERARCVDLVGLWGGEIMSKSMQWLSLIGGILILGYGVFKLFQPQPEWTPMILGLLIVAFSISKIMKSRAQEDRAGQKR